MEKENLAKDIAVGTMVAIKRLKGEGNRERLADWVSERIVLIF